MVKFLNKKKSLLFLVISFAEGTRTKKKGAFEPYAFLTN